MVSSQRLLCRCTSMMIVLAFGIGHVLCFTPPSLGVVSDCTSTIHILSPNTSRGGGRRRRLQLPQPISSTTNVGCRFQQRQHKAQHREFSTTMLQETTTANGDGVDNGGGICGETAPATFHKVAATSLGVLSAVAWILISITALSFHPDPKFANCSLRHNILTMSQAFAFPLPVLYGAVMGSIQSMNDDADENDDSVIERRNILKGGISIASLWLGAACIFPKRFAFGYDLYPLHLKIVTSLIHFATAVYFTLSMTWAKGSTATTNTTVINTTDNNNASSSLANKVGRGISSTSVSLFRLWNLCTFGLVWFAIQPIVVSYPLATVPTILGKRLSRVASAFTLLGAACTLTCSRLLLSRQRQKNNGKVTATYHTLRKSLFVGSFLHLSLLLLKLIGIDGGGILLAGRGLWEVYPAMIAVPFATTKSMILHLLICYTSTIT